MSTHLTTAIRTGLAVGFLAASLLVTSPAAHAIKPPAQYKGSSEPVACSTADNLPCR